VIAVRSRFPWTSTMTLAERLRSKNKALTVEELADLLSVSIRTLYQRYKTTGSHFFAFGVRSASTRIRWLTGWKVR
jgi:hypothetical protein